MVLCGSSSAGGFWNSHAASITPACMAERPGKIVIWVLVGYFLCGALNLLLHFEGPAGHLLMRHGAHSLVECHNQWFFGGGQGVRSG